MKTQEAKKYYFKFKKPADCYGDTISEGSAVAGSRKKAVDIMLNAYEELTAKDLVLTGYEKIVLFDNVNPVTQYLKQMTVGGR